MKKQKSLFDTIMQTTFCIIIIVAFACLYASFLLSDTPNTDPPESISEVIEHIMTMK